MQDGHHELDMSDAFLQKEYDNCYEQLRFYDKRQMELLKYVVTLTTTVVAALFALHKYLEKDPDLYLWCQALLSLVIFVGSLLVLLAMVRNRLYFVLMARQINALRSHFLDNEAVQFKGKNRLPWSAELPAFRWGSVHIHMIFGTSLLSACFVASATFAWGRLKAVPAVWSFTVVEAGLVLLAEILVAYVYLYVKST